MSVPRANAARFRSPIGRALPRPAIGERIEPRASVGERSEPLPIRSHRAPGRAIAIGGERSKPPPPPRLTGRASAGGKKGIRSRGPSPRKRRGPTTEAPPLQLSERERAMAERGGFEPPARVYPGQLLSRQPCSATPAPLREGPAGRGDCRGNWRGSQNRGLF